MIVDVDQHDIPDGIACDQGGAINNDRPCLKRVTSQQGCGEGDKADAQQKQDVQPKKATVSFLHCMHRVMVRDPI